jgi:glycogen(starch) synthase
MHILHILDHSVPLHSGYTFRTLAILKQQRALGWTTLHLTGAKQGHSKGAEQYVDGWHFFRTRRNRALWARLPLLRQYSVIEGLTKRLHEVARLARPDILHAHSPVLNAIAALRVGRKLGIPVVYEVRAFWEDAAANHGTSREGGARYRLTRALETYALHRVDAITTICEGLRRDLCGRGIAQQKVTVIPNAVDLCSFTGARQAPAHLTQKFKPGAGPLLGFIGSFYAYEGLQVLLHALPLILAACPTLRLLLVGGGPQEEQLKALAGRLGLGERVIFAGRVAHDQVDQYYQLLDVLVYPRLPMRLTDLVTPLKPLEAMAQGKVVVASDVGGHRELIADGKTGILFQAGNVQALADTVTALLRQAETWPALRLAARQFVENERNWCASVGRYAGVYQRLIEAGARP